MGKLRYAVDIDLQKNQLLQAVVQNLAAHPASASVGQIYFNTAENKLYVNGGTDVWITASGLYNHPTFTALAPDVTGANVLATFETSAEGHVTAATTRVLTLADLGYTGATDANKYLHPTFTGNDLGTALTGATVVSDVTVNAEGHVTGFATRDLTAADVGAAVINDSLISATTTWSSTKISTELGLLQDAIDDVNSTVAGALVYQGGYDANTNTPDLDTAPVAGAIMQGFTYTITVAGTFFGTPVQIGDMIIAEQNDPTLETHWTIVNKNIPDIVDATDTEKGIIRIATQAEVDAATLNNVAVTPATLVAFYEAKETASGKAADIGDGTATLFDITHNLGLDVLVQVVEIATGTTIMTETNRTSATNVRIICNTAPTASQYRVLIKKM